MGEKKRVCLQDIAERTGYSRMTVSRALRDDPCVAAGTRAVIRRAAKRMGYRPDPKVSQALSKLVRSRYVFSGERIAFLTSDSTEDGWRAYQHNVECFDGAVARAREHGYEMEPFWMRQPGVSVERLSRILLARGIRGVLIAPLGADMIQDGRRSLSLNWSRFSVVQLSEAMDSPRFDCARHDHFDGMIQALYELENLGYRRIGFFSISSLDIRTRHRWYSAYLLWKSTRGYMQDLPVFFYEQLDLPSVVEWVRQCHFDAVLTTHNSLFQEMSGQGVDIPGKLGMAMLDLAIEEKGTLSGICQNAEKTGVAAVDMLMSLIRCREKGIPVAPSQRVCAGYWVEGRTTRRVGPALGLGSLYDHQVRSREASIP